METQDNEDRRAGKPLIREIAWGSVFSGAALALSIYASGYAVYDGIDTRLDDIDLSVSSNSEAKRRQADELGRIILRIERIEATISGCRENIIALQSSTIARPDAVTREEWRDVKNRIHALEQRKP